jgi:hypothetical protein
LDTKDSSLNYEGNNVKGPHANAHKYGITREATKEEIEAETSLGRLAWADQPSPLQARFGSPFALGVRLFIVSSSIRCHIEQISLLTPFTRKPPPQDEVESWMSSSQGSTPAEGRKQEEDSKPLA